MPDPVEHKLPSPRLRVLVVGPSLRIVGGQSIQAARLMERLAETPELEVRFLAVNPVLPGMFQWLQRVRFVRTIVTSLAYWCRLLIEVPRTDVVHAFSASYWSFLLAPVPAMVVGRLFRRHVVLHYHSGEAEDHFRRWGWHAIPLARLARRIIVPSGYLVSVLEPFGLSAEIIPNLVEVSQLEFREREPLRPVFLSNRNLEALYNVGCILKAFHQIQLALPEARLIVVGGGRQQLELETLAVELGLRNVTFVGQIPPGDMGAYYQAADVYLNSPNIDNAPVSILEAFAAGLPVVSTRTGGIPYQVRDGVTGLLVQPDDATALAEAALRLFRETGVASRMARAAREEVLARYTWPQVGSRWLAVYRQEPLPPP